MLAVDLTLTTSKKTIAPRTRQALYRAIDAGVHGAGKADGPWWAGPVADDLELDVRGGFVAASNGARIIDWKTKVAWEDLTIPRSAVDLSCQVARACGVQAICYDDTQAYTEDPADPYVEQERFNNGSVMNKVDDLAAAITWEPDKMMVVGEPAALEPVFSQLTQLLAGRARVIYSEPYFVEVVPEGVGKDVTLMKLGGLLAVPRAATLAIGDGYNDIGMLDYAGLAVAVGNAYPEVKEHADWVAPGNDEDGVAVTIERFILPDPA